MSTPTALLLPLASDPVPEANDVVAGWVFFVILMIGIAAIVVLGRSLTKRLKNVDQAAVDGRYDPSSPRRRRTTP
ncbi:MAG: hypothetical protein CMH83_09645 [Nocardioides sp.]|nr:hypothetical protein [Nocardioides sp.]